MNLEDKKKTVKIVANCNLIIFVACLSIILMCTIYFFAEDQNWTAGIFFFMSIPCIVSFMFIKVFADMVDYIYDLGKEIADKNEVEPQNKIENQGNMNNLASDTKNVTREIIF